MTPTRFTALLTAVSRGLARVEREEVCCGDLTLQQFETLRVLRESGPMTLGAASARLGIDLSTASRNFALLVKQAYLDRRRGTEDARTVAFTLSTKGVACLDAICCEESLAFTKLLERIPIGEREKVGEALALLATALSTDTPPAALCCNGVRCQ